MAAEKGRRESARETCDLNGTIMNMQTKGRKGRNDGGGIKEFP
jgi:hypothetical protein